MKGRVFGLVLAFLLFFGERAIAQTYSVLVNEDSQRVIQKTDGSSVFLLQENLVQQSSESADVHLVFSENGNNLFSGDVHLSQAGMTIQGAVGACQLNYNLEKLGEDSYRASISFCGGSVTPFTWVGNSGSFPSSQMSQFYQNVRFSQPAGSIISKFQSFLAGIPGFTQGDLFAFSFIGGLSGEMIPMGILSAFDECLKKECAECGACWDTPSLSPCHACPQLSFLENTAAWACYTVESVVCTYTSLYPPNWKMGFPVHIVSDPGIM